MKKFGMIRRLGLLLVLASAALAGPALAEDWPSKPVRIIVPYAAGGNSDSMARLAAQRLSEALGQQFIVENRIGANGSIAADTVTRAEPDGYTLLWGVQPAVTVAPVLTKVNFDPIKDFTPISVVGTNPFVLVVNKDIPAKTLAEFVTWVKSQPKTLSYAEGSYGSITHLSMVLFLNRAGLKMTNVSYRGNAPALTDVIAGHLPAMFSNLSDALPHAQSGAVRILAISSAARVPQLPDVPTVAEAGYPGYKVLTWNGLLASTATPKPIVQKIAGEMAKACKDPKFIERLSTLGADPSCITPAEFAELVAADLKQWSEVVTTAGLKQQ